MTRNEAISRATKTLSGITDEPKSEAKIIVAHLAGVEPNRLPLFSGNIEEQALCHILDKRLERIPLQYILGSWWFYGREFFVGDGVLIPRQDTELLVETALELINDIPSAEVCDLCSGSGCVAVSIAGERPDTLVTAVEKYDKAYSFLEKNIAHNRADNVIPKKADVLAESFGSFDLIVSNPPYITKEDMKNLQAEVKAEPHTALFGGEDGLDFYRSIAKNWKIRIKKGGRLAFELGVGEADAVAEILKQENFSEITLKTDLSGVQRVIFGTVGNI